MAENFNQQPNQTVFVSGTIHYSSVGSIIDGQRLDRLNASRQYPVGPHTSITIDNPKIITPGRQQLTGTENWIASHFYNSKKNNVREYQATSNVYNKNNYQLPWVAVKEENGNKAKQYHLGKHEELSAGQMAIVVLRTFMSKKYNRVGATLEGIVVTASDVDHPDVQNFGGSRIGSELRDLGLVLTNPEPIEPNDIPDAPIDPSQLPESMNFDGNVQNNNQTTIQNNSQLRQNTVQPQQNRPQNQGRQSAPSYQNNTTQNPFDPQLQQDDGFSYASQGSVNNDPTPDISNTGDVQSYFDSTDFGQDNGLPQ